MSTINQKTEQTFVDGAIRATGVVGFNYLANKMGMSPKTQGTRALKMAVIVIVNEFLLNMAKTKSWYPKV